MTTYTAIKSLKYHSSIPQCLKKRKNQTQNPWQQAYENKTKQNKKDGTGRTDSCVSDNSLVNLIALMAL